MSKTGTASLSEMMVSTFIRSTSAPIAGTTNKEAASPFIGKVTGYLLSFLGVIFGPASGGSLKQKSFEEFMR